MWRLSWYLRMSTQMMIVLILLTTTAACDLQIGNTHYTPANSSTDPFAHVRAKAEEFYQDGLTAERSGDWRKALEDFRQASLWDHDGRQDIADALRRAESQADWQAYRQSSPVTIESTPKSVTPSPGNATSTVSPTAETNAGRSTPGFTRFDSQYFPYSVAYPRDWVEKPGGTNELPADTFLGESGPNSGALVMITVEPAPFGITLDELYVATEQALNAEKIRNVQIQARRQIAEQPGYVLSYLDTTGSGNLAVRHAIFVTPGKAWHVVLLATPAVTADLDRILNTMLDSFEFNASAFPVQ